MSTENNDTTTNKENSYENPILKDEARDVYFDRAEEDALWDAYMILYDYGYPHEALAPLLHLIEHTTHLSVSGLFRYNQENLDDKTFNGDKNEQDSDE